MTEPLSVELIESLLAAARHCPSFPGYLADTEGNIWSTLSRWRRLHRMTGFPDKDGYLKIKAKRGHRLIKTAIHRMVADAWHGPKTDQNLEIRHLDGSRTNNRPDNLVYGTRSENAIDRKRHGTERAPENGSKSWRKAQETKLRIYGHR